MAPPQAPSIARSWILAASSRVSPAAPAWVRALPSGSWNVTAGKSCGPAGSDGEALAAAAARLLVGIAEHELSAQLVLDEIQLRSQDVHHGARLNHDLDVVDVDHLGTGLDLAREVQLVTEAGTARRLDPEPEAKRTGPLAGQQLPYAVRGRRRQRDRSACHVNLFHAETPERCHRCPHYVGTQPSQTSPRQPWAGTSGRNRSFPLNRSRHGRRRRPSPRPGPSAPAAPIAQAGRADRGRWRRLCWPSGRRPPPADAPPRQLHTGGGPGAWRPQARCKAGAGRTRRRASERPDRSGGP